MVEIIIALCIGITCAICYRIGFNHGLDRAAQIIDFVEEIMKEGMTDDS